MILPKLLYIFQTIPILPPATLLGQLRRIIGRFVWAHRSPQVKWDTLTSAKINGGLALPDFTIYLRSAFVTRIVDWFHNAECKQWVKLGEDAIKLKSLPWVAANYRPVMREMPFLVSSTLKVWDLLVRTFFFLPRSGIWHL